MGNDLKPLIDQVLFLIMIIGLISSLISALSLCFFLSALQVLKFLGFLPQSTTSQGLRSDFRDQFRLGMTKFKTFITTSYKIFLILLKVMNQSPKDVLKGPSK